MVQSALDSEVDRLIERLNDVISGSNCTIATAESLTGGQLAAALSASPGAGEWYRGGIVAYHPEVKHTLLETPDGPVVTAETAAVMARSVSRLLGATYSVALTGVGGPGPEEGEPPGTVYLATFAAGGDPLVAHYCFQGEPIEVMTQSIRAALLSLIHRVEEGT